MDSTNINKSNSFWSNFFKTTSTKQDLQSIICSLPPFERLKGKHVSMLMKLVHQRSYQPNEYIFVEGDPGLGIYFIENGQVRITKEIKDNSEETLAVLSEGDFFGELSAIDEMPRSASAMALTETKVGVIFKPDLDEFIEKFPKEGIHVLRGLAKIISTRLRKFNEEYIELLTNCK